MRRSTVGLAALGLILFLTKLPASAEESQDAPLSILYDTNQKAADKKVIRQMTAPSGPALPRERLALGVNYTGAQLRWNLSPRWAMEGRFQTGKASSNYGDVTAKVFGLRGYRYLHPENRLPFYFGGEMAYTTAEPESSAYKTTGIAAGAFGGMEYRVTRRIALDVDLGPYILSQTEKQTRTSSTNLDFVLNTALIVRVF